MTGKWYCTRDGVQGIPLQPFARQTPAGLMGAARFLCDSRPRTADAFEKANPVVTEWEYSCRPCLIHMLAGSYARILRAAVLQAITMHRMNGVLRAWMAALHRERGQGQVLLTSGQGMVRAWHGGPAYCQGLGRECQRAGTCCVVAQDCHHATHVSVGRVSSPGF